MSRYIYCISIISYTISHAIVRMLLVVGRKNILYTVAEKLLSVKVRKSFLSSAVTFPSNLKENKGLWLAIRLNNWFRWIFWSMCWLRKTQPKNPRKPFHSLGKLKNDVIPHEAMINLRFRDRTRRRRRTFRLTAQQHKNPHVHIKIHPTVGCGVSAPPLCLCVRWAAASMEVPSGLGETAPIDRDLSLTRQERPFPHWVSLNHSCGSDTETKAHRPSTGRGLKCLALRYGSGRDVCGHRALLYSTLCGRGRAFFSRGRGEAWQETAFLCYLFISKTTCWKWCLVIAILTFLPLIQYIHVELVSPQLSWSQVISIK